jgi:galactose-1-phosphate uridylyltransferase
LELFYGRLIVFEIFHHEDNGSIIEYRTEDLTGINSRICPERLKRGIGTIDVPVYSSEGCPFCPDFIDQMTPVFPDGKRIRIGESVTFPNLFPFAKYHVVTVITHDHMVAGFLPEQISNALSAQVLALKDKPGYKSINWNYLPSSGASLPHPHMQGLVDPKPDYLPLRYLSCSRRYFHEHGRSWWNDLMDYEMKSMRHLTGMNLFWYAHPVPIGEKELRCVLPITSIQDFTSYIDNFSEDLVKILNFYNYLGNGAWNMSVFFGSDSDDSFFSAFCILIARINPNPLSTSDTAFMERLHFEPVIMTLPEEMGILWRKYCEII